MEETTLAILRWWSAYLTSQCYIRIHDYVIIVRSFREKEEEAAWRRVQERRAKARQRLRLLAQVRRWMNGGVCDT